MSGKVDRFGFRGWTMRRRRQHQGEHAAFAWLARHLDEAAMRLGDALHEVQAEPAALDLLRHGFAAAIERLEDVLAILGVDAEAAIFDGEANPAGSREPGTGNRRDPDPALGSDSGKADTRTIGRAPNLHPLCSLRSADPMRRSPLSRSCRMDSPT